MVFRLKYLELRGRWEYLRNLNTENEIAPGFFNLRHSDIVAGQY